MWLKCDCICAICFTEWKTKCARVWSKIVEYSKRVLLNERVVSEWMSESHSRYNHT